MSSETWSGRRCLLVSFCLAACISSGSSESLAVPDVRRVAVGNVESVWFTPDPQELIGIANGDQFVYIAPAKLPAARYLHHGNGYFPGVVSFSASWDHVLLGSGDFVCCQSNMEKSAVRVIPTGNPEGAYYVHIPDAVAIYPGRCSSELIAVTRFAASDPRAETFRELIAVDVVTKERGILRTFFEGFVCSPRGPSLTYITLDDGDYEICALLPDSHTIGRLPKQTGKSVWFHLSPQGDRLAIKTDSGVTFYTIQETLELGTTTALPHLGAPSPTRVEDLTAAFALLHPLYNRYDASQLPDEYREYYMEEMRLMREQIREAATKALGSPDIMEFTFGNGVSPVAITIATGETLLIDFNTGSLTGSLDSGADVITATCFDPSGRYLARIKATCGAEIWDVETQRLVALAPLSPWEAMTLVAPSCTFSPDGETLLIVEPGKAVHLVTGWKE